MQNAQRCTTLRCWPASIASCCMTARRCATSTSCRIRANAPQSSLGYMMGRVGNERGDGRTGWYLRGDELLFEPFVADLQEADRASASRSAWPRRAFALVHLLEAMDARGICAFGFHAGRASWRRAGSKDAFAAIDRERALRPNLRPLRHRQARQIVAEYGMTELTSQYYDESGRADRERDARPRLRGCARASSDPIARRSPTGTSGRCYTSIWRTVRPAWRFRPRILALRLDDGVRADRARDRGRRCAAVRSTPRICALRSSRLC